jgi:hypothetical protein
MRRDFPKPLKLLKVVDEQKKSGVVDERRTLDMIVKRKI